MHLSAVTLVVPEWQRFFNTCQTIAFLFPNCEGAELMFLT